MDGAVVATEPKKAKTDSQRATFILTHSGAAPLDPVRLNDLWNTAHSRPFKCITGVVDRERLYHVLLELGCEKRESAVANVVALYGRGRVDGFQLVAISHIRKTGDKSPSQTLLAAGKEECTAWAWTPERGLVGHRGEGYNAELEAEKETNAVLKATKDREIERLQALADQGGANSGTLQRLRSERDRFRREAEAKDAELAKLKACLAAAQQSAQDGARAKAATAALQAEGTRLAAEVCALRTKQADNITLRDENDRLRADKARWEQGFEDYAVKQVRAHCAGAGVITDMNRVLGNPREEYARVLAKLAHTMRAGAEERVDWFAREVERLNRQVADGVESSDVELLEYCSVLKAQNDEMHVNNEADAASWEKKAADLQQQLDDARFSESMLQSKVRSLQDAFNASSTHSQARSFLMDTLEGHAREALDAVARGMGTDPNGAVHQELAIKYNCTQASTRAERSEWAQIHESPTFRLGMDFGRLLVQNMEEQILSTERDAARAERERDAAIQQFHEVRERSDKLLRSEKRAERLLAAYAKERPRLLVARRGEGPVVEAAAVAVVAELRDVGTLASALQGEIRSLVERRQWCEAIRSRSKILSQQIRFRAQHLPMVDAEWKAEKEFLLVKCLPELEDLATSSSPKCSR